jgi:sugar phosphate permease
MLGPLLVAASLVVLATGGTPSGTRILVALALLGIGIGFGAPPSVESILAATPAEQSAAGSAVADVAMQSGGALGIAIMGSLAATASADNFTTAMAVGAAVVGAGAVTAVAVLPRRPATLPVRPLEVEATLKH